MGNNFCLPSFSISCDDAISQCIDCTVRQARYINELQDNLIALQREMQKLNEAKNDVRTRVILAEQQQMKRLEQVQGWFSRVQDIETEVAELMETRSAEVEKLCLGGFCSKKCRSSYRFGKRVLNTLRGVKDLRDEGDFKDVAQMVPENSVDERPIATTIVGLQPIFDKVWRCLTEEEEGIIGIYGMGGVGKTTLLTQINNKFLDIPNRFDVVIWVVASRELEVEKIQESMAKKIGLFNESWKSKSLQEKAQEIFKILSKKKFVLLLDDIWEEIDLNKVGLPLPNPRSASKVVFTTRKFEVCGSMEAHKCFKVECLRYEDAWKLFEEKVGRDILNSHPNIRELAEIVAKECGGLPLTLIVVGRAMASKKTPQEWEHAIEVLRHSTSKFSGMEKRVFSRLKFSYDFLPSDTVRLCLLYCTLFSEDFHINIEDLIDYWICEGILDEYDGIGARNEGYSIVGNLVHACLLEEEENNCVRMHDVIRDMALWIASTMEKEKEEEKFLVLTGIGLTQVPSIQMWKEVTRMSLMGNKIQNLLESPPCPCLKTLFLSWNDIQMVESGFFQSMTSLRVLNLSDNFLLSHTPFQFSDLLSLQHLNLSYTSIERLPEELKYLVNLKCFNLEFAFSLHSIQPQLISSLKMLQVLRMFECGSRTQEEHSILVGGSELLVEELLGLSHLNTLTSTLRSFRALQVLSSSPTLQSSARSLCLKYFNNSKSLSVFPLASLSCLETIHFSECYNLEELKIEYPETHGFYSLHEVYISYCSKLRHITWLIFAPNLKDIQIDECRDMEEIIKLDEVPTEVLENLIPFSRLQFLKLEGLRNLKSIHSNALSFPHLKEMTVKRCLKLKKLPLDGNRAAAEGNKLIIKGEECWWKELQWDDEATQSAIISCFKSIDNDEDFE